MFKIWCVCFPLRFWFFSLSRFTCFFREWLDVLKEIEESSSRHGIAVTYLLAEGRSWVFSSIDQFLENFFFLYRNYHKDIAIISLYLCDNFVISFPSSTAHFNWIPHEFSVLLASCLSIKLRTAAHVFFVNTLGVTHFNTLVRFVFP